MSRALEFQERRGTSTEGVEIEEKNGKVTSRREPRKGGGGISTSKQWLGLSGADNVSKTVN